MNHELQRLASAVCDNHASDPQLKRLGNLLREDAVCRDEYLRYVDLHAALCDEALPSFESDIVDYRMSVAGVVGNERPMTEVDEATSPGAREIVASSTTVATKAIAGWFAIAVSVLVVAGVGYSWMRSRAKDAAVDNHSSLIAERPTATLLLSEDCVWISEPLREGDRLSAGRIELERGTAAVRFDGGAELVVVGPAEMELQSAGRVRVHFGDVVIRATDGAEGFMVMTPTSEIVDLGTEFAVKVSRRGTTEVQVLDGEVSFRGLGVSEALSEILRAGEGITIDENGRHTAVAMDSPRFRDLIRRVNPGSRADLLTAYEGFNYSPGTLPLGDSTVGIGWEGPWRKRLASERDRPSHDVSPDWIEIVHGEMDVAWPVPGGRLGAMKLPGGGVYYVRPMTRSLDLSEESVTFFSLMVRETERRGGKQRPRERLRLTFRSSEQVGGPAISFGHSSRYRPTVSMGNGIVHVSPFPLPPEQTTLWIGKIISRKVGEDEIYFRVYGRDDELGYAEPATWHVVARNVRLDATLDLVLISSEGETQRLVDELRIGPTWRSVAPILEAGE